jgi:hypothetical protein
LTGTLAKKARPRSALSGFEQVDPSTGRFTRIDREFQLALKLGGAFATVAAFAWVNDITNVEKDHTHRARDDAPGATAGWY